MSLANDTFSLICIGSFLFGAFYIAFIFLAGNIANHVGGHAPIHSIITEHSVHGIAHHATPIHGTSHFNIWHKANILSIAIFGLIFGFTGYIFHNTLHLLEQIAVLLALVIGVILAIVILSILDRLFEEKEGTSIQDIVDLSGMLASVSISIPSNGLGEIMYTSPAGMRKPIAAKSIDGKPIPSGAEVVVQSEKDGIAEVDTWDKVIGDKEIQNA